MLQTNVANKNKTHILCSIYLPPRPGNRVVQQTMQQNVAQSHRPQTATQCGAAEMQFARQITKTRIQTHSHTQNN